MNRALNTLFHVVVAITCFDIVAWVGDYYSRKIGEHELQKALAREHARESGAKSWSTEEGRREAMYQKASYVYSHGMYIYSQNYRWSRNYQEFPMFKSDRISSLLDGWGNEMRMEKDENGNIYLVSAGADEEFETEDDLKQEIRPEEKRSRTGEGQYDYE